MADAVYSPMTSIGSGLVDPSQHFTLLAQQIWRLSISFPLLIDAESNTTCTYVFCFSSILFLFLYFVLNRSRRRQTLSSRLTDQ